MSETMFDYVTTMYTRLCDQKASLQRAYEEGFCIDQNQWQRVCRQKKLAFDLMMSSGRMY